MRMIRQEDSIEYEVVQSLKVRDATFFPVAVLC